METTEFKKYTEYKDKLLGLAKRIGFNLNLDNPKTIQDKLNWLKIYDSTPLKTKCADKIKLREYCKEKIGEDLCIPILFVYDKTDDIDWNKLPNRFVIKCNHGSGMNIIVKDKEKANKIDIVKKLNTFMKDDFAFHVGYEMHYHNIPHKIFVEEYMTDDKQSASLLDYKFWCFNGTPRFMTVNDGNGHGRMNFYDVNFNKIDLERTDFKAMITSPEKPKTFEKMLEYAKILSKDFKFVRVDFYEIAGKLFLGELTFTPGAGFFKFKNPENDKKVGDMLVLGLNQEPLKKNVLIVHYNTQKITEACIKSINKHMNNCQIYIFDNSDKTPFKNTFSNVIVIDNTRGQVIDFDKIIKSHAEFYNKKATDNNFGSFKHCISVETAMNLLGKNFVLLDSDVLIKNNFSSLYDVSKIFVGKLEKMPRFKKRVEPFMVFINTEMCKKNNVHFYNENRMWGFYNTSGENYDTGCWFYEACTKFPKKEVNTSLYMEHFRAASWYKDAVEKQKYRKISPELWLDRHKSLWYSKDDAGEKTIKENKFIISKTNFFDIFNHIYCLHYLPASDRLPKLKEELKRVGIDENADYFSWVYDYPTPLLDNIYKDSRLNMNTALKSSSREYIKRVSMKHYEIAKEAYALNYERILILENDVRFHKDLDYISTMLSNIPDTDVVMFDKMVCSAPSEDIKYKRYVKTLPEDALYGDMNESGVFFIFCSCYALNRKAMKHIIDAHEKNLLPPDTPLNDKTLTGSFAVINLAIQDPKLKTRKSETYDKIGLNTDVYDPISDEEKVVKNDSKPKQVAKPQPQPAQQAKPKPIIKPKAQKQDISPKVVFRVPTKPQLKKKIEVDTSKKPTQEEQVIKHTKPIVTRMVNPKKTTRSRIIVGKSSGFNKLYDV